MELHTTHPTVRRRLPCYDLLVLVGCNTIQFSPQSLNLPVNGTKENGAEKFRKICPVYRTDWVGKWESTPSPIAPGSFSRNFSWNTFQRAQKKKETETGCVNTPFPFLFTAQVTSLVVSSAVSRASLTAGKLACWDFVCFVDTFLRGGQSRVGVLQLYSM